METNKRNYNFIDILKFFFMLCVIALHCHIELVFGRAGWYVLHCIFRLAVPFFFVASGFFFMSKLEKSGGGWTDNKIIYTKNISSTFILCYTEYISWCVPKNHQQLSVFNKMVCKNHSEDFIWSAWSNVVSFCLHIWNYIFISISKKK